MATHAQLEDSEHRLDLVLAALRERRIDAARTGGRAPRRVLEAMSAFERERRSERRDLRGGAARGPVARPPV